MRRTRTGRARRAVAALGLAFLAMAAGGEARAGVSNGRASADVLYDAGTAALSRGDVGPAVTLLKAAARIEPRAADIRANLSLARKWAAARYGGPDRTVDVPGSPSPVSAGEVWWLAASLLVLAAVVGGIGARRRSRALLIAAPAGLLAVGLGVAAFEAARAIEEVRHPEAVVVVPILAAGPAADERPRPPYLFGAGEEVRLGRRRGPQVELWIGGNPIGWAPASGLWRVADATRYTGRADSKTERMGG